MKIKLFLILCFLFNLTIGYSQTTKQEAHKDSLKSQNLLAKNLEPEKGKALVFIIRPSMMAFAVKMGVYCDSNKIGINGPGEFVYIELNPGKHIFTSKSENTFSMDLELLPNTTYYIKQEVKIGMLYARTKLELVKEETGKHYLGKSTLSKQKVTN